MLEGTAYGPVSVMQDWISRVRCLGVQVKVALDTALPGFFICIRCQGFSVRPCMLPPDLGHLRLYADIVRQAMGGLFGLNAQMEKPDDFLVRTPLSQRFPQIDLLVG